MTCKKIILLICLQPIGIVLLLVVLCLSPLLAIVFLVVYYKPKKPIHKQQARAAVSGSATALKAVLRSQFAKHYKP